MVLRGPRCGGGAAGRGPGGGPRRVGEGGGGDWPARGAAAGADARGDGRWAEPWRGGPRAPVPAHVPADGGRGLRPRGARVLHAAARATQAGRGRGRLRGVVSARTLPGPRGGQ